jgi:hypothetical protein
MPVDRQHLQEGASVQVTPAQPTDPATAPDAPETHAPQEDKPAVTSIKTGLIKRILGPLGALMLVLLVACTPNLAPQTPTQESAGLDDSAQVTRFAGIPIFHVSDDTHPAPTWHAHLRVDKRDAITGDLYEVVEADHNLLLTAGATALWNCLSGGTCSTTFSTTNAQLVVGDGSTAPAVGNTDMSAAVATKINAADVTSCTNATPIVCSGTYSPAAVAGQVYEFAGFAGAGASAINNTFEASAGSSSSITLLNSAGSGSITVTGATIKPINKYRQQANASGSAVVTTNQIVYVATFGTTSANFAWNEWGVSTGAAATNKQAVPPPTLLNRATPGGGLGTKTSAASWTLTVTLSLS